MLFGRTRGTVRRARITEVVYHCLGAGRLGYWHPLHVAGTAHIIAENLVTSISRGATYRGLGGECEREVGEDDGVESERGPPRCYTT